MQFYCSEIATNLLDQYGNFVTLQEWYGGCLTNTLIPIWQSSSVAYLDPSRSQTNHDTPSHALRNNLPTEPSTGQMSLASTPIICCIKKDHCSSSASLTFASVKMNTLLLSFGCTAKTSVIGRRHSVATKEGKQCDMMEHYVRKRSNAIGIEGP
jgi:hypothetical protein